MGLALVGALLLSAGAAEAKQVMRDLKGRFAARFQWTPSSGPVAGYAMYIARDKNKRRFPRDPDLVVWTASAEVNARGFGDSIAVRVAAFDAHGNFGPFSPPSEAVRFLPADSDFGGANTPPLRLPGVDRFDFDGDGVPDVVWLNGETGAETVAAGGGVAGDLSGSLPLSLGAQWQTIGVGDFDGDGFSDLVIRQARNGQNALLLRRRDVVVGVGPLPPTTNADQLHAVADFDGDGDDDLFWSDAKSSVQRVWRIDAASVAEEVRLPNRYAGDWDVVGAADFDANGSADLLWLDLRSGRTVIWSLAQGSFLAAQEVDGRPGPTWIAAGCGDFDGDGVADVLWRDTQRGRNLIWQMDGGRVAKRLTVTSQKGTWEPIAVADFNADGRADVLWRTLWAPAQAVIWLMDGRKLVKAVPAAAPSGPEWASIVP